MPKCRPRHGGSPSGAAAIFAVAEPGKHHSAAGTVSDGTALTAACGVQHRVNYNRFSCALWVGSTITPGAPNDCFGSGAAVGENHKLSPLSYRDRISETNMSGYPMIWASG